MAANVRSGPVIIFLLILLIFLILGGILWFDVLGLINSRGIFSRALQGAGLQGEQATEVDYSDIELLDSMAIQKRELAIELRMQELNTLRETVSIEMQEYEERLANLEEREKILTNREISFNNIRERYDDRRAGLVQNARDLTNMRPENAVAILNEYDDQLLIDTLRTVEELANEAGSFSLVSTYLALLPEERAAQVQRKMTLKPQAEASGDS